MKLTIKSFFSSLLLLVCTCCAQAQVARLYTTQHGLKTNDCRSVSIDHRGFVWVAGSDMLGMFDGTKFHYEPIMSEDGKRALFQTAYSVKEYKDDQYWVATSHGLFLLNSRNNEFKRIFLRADEDSIYGYAVNSIIDYPKPNHKLVTTDGFGNFVINTETMKPDSVLTETMGRIMNSAFSNQPIIDKNKQLWFANNSVISRIDINKMKAVQINYTIEAQTLILQSKVEDIKEIGDNVYIGTNHGLFAYNRKKDIVEFVEQSRNLYVTSIIYTHDKRILIGTDGRGIWNLTNDTNLDNISATTLTPISDSYADFEITFGKVMDMQEDHDGNVIAIFLQKGMAVIPPQNGCFHYYPISPINNGKNATSITSIAIDKDSNYWVGTDGCGVFTTNGMKLSSATPMNNGLRSPLVQNLKIDKRGTIWIATYGGGVQYLENGKWTDGGWLSSLSTEFVMDIYYDEKFDKILAGTNGNGIYEIDITNHTVQKFDVPISYNPWIAAMTIDDTGTVWLGTSGNLLYFNRSTGHSGEIILNGGRLSNICSIEQDDNKIYFCSDKGLVIFDTKTHEQTCIDSSKGLKSDVIRAVTFTDTHIWVATRTSIASINKKTKDVRNYSSFNGYNIGEFHKKASLAINKDYVLFGGDNGIICFSPNLISSRKQDVKEVYFTNFVTPFHSEKMDASILYASSIDLEYSNSSFSISFSSTELGDPERIHYDYILEGHEEQWHTDTQNRTVSYSSLQPGHYTFKVKAYHEDTPNEYTEKEIQIYVASPWYWSVWAIIAYIIILVAIGWFVYLMLMNRKKSHELIRKTAEQDRMKEAKLNLFTSITHEMRSPLMMIESPLKQLMSEDENPEHQNLYSVMQRNCDRLLGVVKQITDIRKIDAGQFKLKLEEQDYVEYADQVFEQFKGVATVKNISFIVEHSEEELTMMMDKTHFEKIITNILSNAFKFTPEGGKIIARSGIVGSNVELRFYNSGSHFNEEDLSHLWERFYQGSAGDKASGSGIGLNLVYELTRMHHGTIQANNIKPDGVEFTLHFPYFNTQSTNADNMETNVANNKPMLLIVDDDSEIVSYMRSQFEKDFNIITAFSGESGWKQVLSKRPDVVVTDYRMPNGNGVELSQLIKSNPETDNIPIIMLTGEGDEMLQLHSLNIQVDHYLEKPVNVMVLKGAINQVLRVRENMRNKVRRTEMGSDIPTVEIENPDDKLFKRISDSIKSHLDDSEFSITQLAEEVGVSRGHLNRKMKERYGVSPNVFIKSFRLKRAAFLLVNQKANVSEIAYMVGFSSHSYFTTSFHDYFGMSPREFVTYYSEEENNDAFQKLLE